MSNIFKDFVLARPVKTPLDFGHNENIKIESIDFKERKKKGIKIKANTFIKLTKINPKDESIVANTEINFWDLDPTKDFIYDNFISQFSVLCGVIDALGGDVDAYETEVLDVVKGDNDSEMLSFLKKPVNAKAVQDILSDAFEKQVTGKYGLKGPSLKCKMISNKSGYLQPANDIMWILSMNSGEKLPSITAREKRVYDKALKSDNKKAKPDTPGNAPTTEKTPEAKVTNSSSLDSI